MEHAERCRFSAVSALPAGVNRFLARIGTVLPSYDFPSWPLLVGDVVPSLSKLMIDEGSVVPPYAELVLEAGIIRDSVPDGADLDDPGAGIFICPTL